jgi:hypothetical protein
VAVTATAAAAIATTFVRRDRIGTNLMPSTPTCFWLHQDLCPGAAPWTATQMCRALGT